VYVRKFADGLIIGCDRAHQTIQFFPYASPQMALHYLVNWIPKYKNLPKINTTFNNLELRPIPP